MVAAGRSGAGNLPVFVRERARAPERAGAAIKLLEKMVGVAGFEPTTQSSVGGESGRERFQRVAWSDLKQYDPLDLKPLREPQFTFPVTGVVADHARIGGLVNLREHCWRLRHVFSSSKCDGC